MTTEASVRVDVLGPLRLTVDGAAVDVRGTKRRAVLALLALAEGRTVTVERFADALWPTDLPESARQALHSHVFRLRSQLGAAAGRLETGPAGYRLALGREELDLAEARGLLATGRGLAGSDPEGALAALERAHALWRGPALADLLEVPPLQAAAEACAELHREVTDALVESGLAAGRGQQVLEVATASVAEDGLREPAVLLLVRALAATGRAAEALQVAREFRTRLADETGLDPSPALGELERSVAGGAAGPGAAPTTRGERAPRPATRLLGRDAELGALHRLLAAERLVTVVGPGGIGKTRLALEVALGTENATVLHLASVTDGSAVPHALAAALGLDVVRGDVLTACCTLLGDRSGLLVVDNCEHLLPAVGAMVDQVLTDCPHVAVLATSREPLGLPGEYVSRLAPLPLPHQDDRLTAVPSVAVFLERARRARPQAPVAPDELPLVADVVRRLDGMPLAIELAAGRLSSLSVAELRARLDRSLDLLGSPRPGAESRHRTLRATVDWSYQLLDEDERRLFRHLAVFPDGLALDDAERLAAEVAPSLDPGAPLARLVDASMVEAELGSPTRYRMLETLRAFGLDRLEDAGELTDAEERLVSWAVDLAARVGAGLAGEDEPEADALLRREMANLRAVWRLAMRRDLLEEAAAIVVALFDAVGYRDLVELRDWAEELAARDLSSLERPSLVLGVAAEAAYHRGDLDRAEGLARDGLERARDGADTWACQLPWSVVALARGEHEEVVERALAGARATGVAREALGVAALAKAYLGDLDGARVLQAQGEQHARSLSMRSWSAYVAGEIASLAGQHAEAEAHYERAADLARRAGASFLVGIAVVGLVAGRGRTGRTREALLGYRDVVDYFARTGNWTHLWTTLRNLAALLRSLGDEPAAAALETAADAAPDAPAVDGRRAATTPARPAPDRAEVLEIARSGIRRHLEVTVSRG
ncbi:ATP-binding protein [Nocardioides caldifontis]|uniref:ATP-binding protein n=1 Tax=Nocardioides caldifontis TaxID=2588938 RepID=UPI0011DF23EA|nr:BTAD domain-containing putative transcriptional regulator [Nocardioides caldifontis]